MSQVVNVHSASDASLAGNAGKFLRWVGTKNPFYVISALLFLWGLRVSFGQQLAPQAGNFDVLETGNVEAWALMSGLAGYTLLLAVTACLLVRFGNVWDDVRTVLLLVVFMFLVTSLTFDRVLSITSLQGIVCFLLGLFLAVAVTEGVLRGIRLRLPAWYRLPYYLILSIFFLYPVALKPLLDEPRSEALMWALFGFSSLAGMAFLTLLPAIRRGAEYVRDNGSPWSWPMYPGVLFGVLALAVPVRAWVLCFSLHHLEGYAVHETIFGPYFLVPFGLAVTVLLLELGLVSGHGKIVAIALAAPVGLVVLALIGHRRDLIYRDFQEIFASRLGSYPLYLTMLGSIVFYIYAAVRRVPLAADALTIALVALAFVSPETTNLNQLARPQLVPILAAGALQLGFGLWRRSAVRCLLGAGGVVAGIALVLSTGTEPLPFRGPIVLHLALAATLIVGAVFDDPFGRFIRVVGVCLVLGTCLSVIFLRFEQATALPSWATGAYPLVMAMILAAYGLVVGHWPSVGAAMVVLVFWLVAAGWREYSLLREAVTGMDYIALSLAVFAVAVLISLAKSRVLTRWRAVEQSVMPGGPTSARS